MLMHDNFGDQKWMNESLKFYVNSQNNMIIERTYNTTILIGTKILLFCCFLAINIIYRGNYYSNLLRH